MYKLSKYNYFTENKNGDLLLFNTLNGTRSFLKIPKEKSKIIQKAFSAKRPIDELPVDLQDKLSKLGYIVKTDIDEDNFLKLHYLEKVNNSILNLTILPTEQCNFRCKYCYESFPDNYMSEDAQNSIIKFLYKNLKKYSGLHISWFGGEPLEGFEVIKNISEKAMQLCKKLGKPYTASITTNAYNLSLDVFRCLLKYNVLSYQITIDGVKSIHDNQRPHKTDSVSTFDKIISNLIDIRDSVKTQTFKVTIRSNFSIDNINHIDEYKKFFHERFAWDKRFQFLIRPVMNLGGDRINQFSDQLIDGNDYSVIYKAILNSGYPLNFTYDNLLECGSICYAGEKNSFVITPEGGIYKCTCDYANEPESRIGTMSLNGDMNIDQYKYAQWICSFLGCKNKNCFYKPICFADACPSKRVFKRNGNCCPFEKEDLSLILQVLDQENKLFKE